MPHPWFQRVRVLTFLARIRSGLLRNREPPSPTNYSNLVYQQNDHRRQRDPGGQRVASEEVQGHACPAEACSYQGATNIWRSNGRREACAMSVPEPEEHPKCPHHDEELNRDSYLRPTFPSHRGYSNWARSAWRRIATGLWRIF